MKKLHTNAFWILYFKSYIYGLNEIVILWQSCSTLSVIFPVMELHLFYREYTPKLLKSAEAESEFLGFVPDLLFLDRKITWVIDKPKNIKMYQFNCKRFGSPAFH